MPRRSAEEVNPNWRYSSVTLPKEFLYYLDQIILQIGQVEGTTTTGTFLPSRRSVVQDAVEMYISEIYPELHGDYVEMLKDCGMYQRTKGLNEWITKRQLERAG